MEVLPTMTSSTNSKYLNIKQAIISKLGDDYIDATNVNNNTYELRFNCPFCRENGDTHNDHKMYIRYDKLKPGVFWCHRCESKGRVALNDLIISGSVTDAYDLLNKYLSSDIVNDEEESEYYIIPKTKPSNNSMPYEYLKSRGITDEDIEYYNIRVGELDNKQFYGRIVIPNKVFSKRWTDMYIARTFLGDKIRYKNPSSSKSHSLVFNLHNIEDNCDRIIINEGVINSIIAGRDSVATFGKYVSSDQLKLILSKNPKKVYVSLDTDAKDIAIELCERIRKISNCKVYLVELPDNKDASDLGKDKYLEILDNSKEYVNKSIYLINNYINEKESY